MPTLEKKLMHSRPVLWVFLSKDLSYWKINISIMPYTKDELKSELLRCYKENGEVTTEILNNSENNYPTQATYHNRFGSLRNAKESVGIIAGNTREDVISDIKKCYNKYGEVSNNKLNEDDSIVNYSVVYKHFGSLSEAVEQANINWDDAQCDIEHDVKYSRDELIQNLIDCKESEGNTKTSTINSFGGPTSTVYRDRFGSIVNARKEAGVEDSFKRSKNSELNKLLDDANIDKDADAIIYVLSITVNDEQAYYVGETANIRERMSMHVYRTKIQSWANGPYGKILAPRSKTNEINDIEINSIEYTIPLYKNDGESDIEFRRRRKFKEHHEHLSVAIDKDTLEVYGGR